MRNRARAVFAPIVCLVAAIAPAAAAKGPEGALESRAWEMVSPAAKGGGEVSVPGRAGTGAFQAAAQGGAFAFASATSFGEAAGAPPISQYRALRGATGWSTLNVSPPLFSGTYEGGAYLLFSADLSRAILTNGWRCRDGAPECEAENPPLASGAPAGYPNLYLRDFATATYVPLITTANAPALALPAEKLHLTLVGASPDLGEALISTCAALTAGSTEVPDGDGCDASAPNLYRYSAGTLAEVEPDDWEADFDPGIEVQGILGASIDRTRVYFANASGIWLWDNGANVKVANGAGAADPSTFPASTGTARVTPSGSHLAFLSTASLTGYANVGKAEAFVYDAAAKELHCASCNPRGKTPAGPTSLPGAIAAGEGSAAIYKPRALSEDGKRLFFTSADALLLNDTNSAPDAYQWLAPGAGGCTQKAGCVGLLSSGREGSASFLDASEAGTDAYFSTVVSLLSGDTGGLDVYDARAGGGFPDPAAQIPCVGDACQGPAPGPEDPAPGSALFRGPHNPPVRFAPEKCKKAKGKKGGCHKPRKGGKKGKKSGHRSGGGR